MRNVDAQTLLRLWRTSSPEARRRDRQEARVGSPVYDIDSEEPRAYVARCAFCGVRVLVMPTSQERRWCSIRCAMRGNYQRDRERILARYRAYSARRRALARDAA